MPEQQPDPNLMLGAEMRQKFHFYFLGLTFGVLALSVQTASFEAALVAQAAELLGWILLLVSGLAGLWRIEGIPDIHRLAGLRAQTEIRIHELQMGRERGTTTVHVTLEGRDYPIEESIAHGRADLTTLESRMDHAERVANWVYRVQRYTFVVGMLSLMVARGYAPLLGIIGEFRAGN